MCISVRLPQQGEDRTREKRKKKLRARQHTHCRDRTFSLFIFSRHFCFYPSAEDEEENLKRENNSVILSNYALASLRISSAFVLMQMERNRRIMSKWIDLIPSDINQKRVVVVVVVLIFFSSLLTDELLFAWDVNIEE